MNHDVIKASLKTFFFVGNIEKKQGFTSFQSLYFKLLKKIFQGWLYTVPD